MTPRPVGSRPLPSLVETASRRARRLGALGALGVALGAGQARADLRDDARRVEARWRQARQRVERLPAFFLESGRRQRLAVGDRTGCVTVAVVATRSADFALRSLSEAGARMERPAAGVVQVSRCGDEAGALAQLAVEMRTGRGAFEALVAVGGEPAPDAREALVERVVMPTRPVLDPGRAPQGEPLAARAARAEGRARGEGAAEVATETLSSGDEGQGHLLRAWREGCHRVDLIAEAGPGGRVGDIDAELRAPGTDALLTRDRSETPDGRLEFCLGEPTGVALTYRGGPARGEVRMVHARWAMPEALPTLWGGKARGAMAYAIGRRRAPAPRGRPVQMATGVGGPAVVSLETAPGACYLALVGAARGEVRSLALTAEVDGQVAHDEGGQGRDGLAVTFCSRGAARVPLQLDSRGAGLLWGLAVWRLGAPVEGTR